MTWGSRTDESSTGPVRLHARRVALGATVLALAVYLIACAIADFAAINRIYNSTDARLGVRLTELAKEIPHGIVTATPAKARIGGTSNDDLDDAPILAWYVPKNSSVGIHLSPHGSSGHP